MEKRFHLFAALTREIFFPLEDKLHMFAPLCNIPYISYFGKLVYHFFSLNNEQISWTFRDLVKQISYNQTFLIRNVILSSVHKNIPGSLDKDYT